MALLLIHSAGTKGLIDFYIIIPTWDLSMGLLPRPVTAVSQILYPHKKENENHALEVVMLFKVVACRGGWGELEQDRNNSGGHWI